MQVKRLSLTLLPTLYFHFKDFLNSIEYSLTLALDTINGILEKLSNEGKKKKYYS